MWKTVEVRGDSDRMQFIGRKCHWNLIVYSERLELKTRFVSLSFWTVSDALLHMGHKR